MREKTQSSSFVRKIKPVVTIFKEFLSLSYDIDKFYKLTVLLQQNGPFKQNSKSIALLYLPKILMSWTDHNNFSHLLQPSHKILLTDCIFNLFLWPQSYLFLESAVLISGYAHPFDFRSVAKVVDRAKFTLRAMLPILLCCKSVVVKSTLISFSIRKGIVFGQRSHLRWKSLEKQSKLLEMLLAYYKSEAKGLYPGRLNFLYLLREYSCHLHSFNSIEKTVIAIGKGRKKISKIDDFGIVVCFYSKLKHTYNSDISGSIKELENRHSPIYVKPILRWIHLSRMFIGKSRNLLE